MFGTWLGIGIGIAMRQQAINLEMIRYVQDFPDLEWIEDADPAAANADIPGLQHHVGRYNGSVGQVGAETVRRPLPAISHFCTDGQDAGRFERIGGRFCQPADPIGLLYNKDSLGLAVASGWCNLASPENKRKVIWCYRRF